MGLTVTLIVTLVLLLIRVWFGPVPGLISVRTTLNVEAIAFLAFCGRLMASTISGASNRETAIKWFYVFAVGLATAAAFAPGMQFPFLFDDYQHLTFARSESWRALLDRVLLNHPTGGDLFFRPLGDFAFLWLYQAAHFQFQLWHAASLILHLANTALVILLAKRISGGWLGPVVGGLFFGWHASHVEAVNWVSGLYDLLATLFVLTTLLGVTGSRRYFSLIVGTLLACVSKESAYCLPLLAAILVQFQPPASRRVAWSKTWCVTVVCGSALAFRFWYLRGLGGYQAAAGGSLAGHLRAVSLLQAVGLRLWAQLWVPVNWSVPPGLALKVAFVGLTLALLGFAKRARLSARRLGLLLLFTVSAALPAVSVLLIGFDLSGARALYLPSAAMALLWAEIAERVPNFRESAVFSALLLAFQLVALEHNQMIWGSVARESQQACTSAGAILQHDKRSTLLAVKLPRSKEGVFFLHNAFAPCVAINASVDAGRIQVGDDLPKTVDADRYVVRWDESNDRLVIRRMVP
jgi:hypothetical protein